MRLRWSNEIDETIVRGTELLAATKRLVREMIRAAFAIGVVVGLTIGVLAAWLMK